MGCQLGKLAGLPPAFVILAGISHIKRLVIAAEELSQSHSDKILKAKWTPGSEIGFWMEKSK
jgi:hypothetical protein